MWIHFHVFWNIGYEVYRKLCPFQLFSMVSYESEYWLGELGWCTHLTFPSSNFPSIKWVSWSYPRDLSLHEAAGPAESKQCSRLTWEGPLEIQQWKQDAASFLTMAQRDWFKIKNQLKGVSIKLEINRHSELNSQSLRTLGKKRSPDARLTWMTTRNEKTRKEKKKEKQER